MTANTRVPSSPNVKKKKKKTKETYMSTILSNESHCLLQAQHYSRYELESETQEKTKRKAAPNACKQQ